MSHQPWEAGIAVRRSRFVALLIGVLSVTSAGCAVIAKVVSLVDPGVSLTVKPYDVGPPPAAGSNRPFQVGSADVDITPPPGFPTGGHGPVGNLARGYWGRLHARAFFFRDPQGRTLTMVSCDLFALPRGLQADVARRVALQWRPHVWLPPEAIILAATHTHQGPGNYMTASTYNDFGSFVPGFSKKLFDFLSDRIADAVNMAIARAISDPGGAELLVRTASVDASAGLQLNRSPRTFFLNWNRLGIMDALSGTTPLPAGECDPARSEPRDAWDLEGCPRLRAVDPNITLLQVRRAGATTGVLVFFAAHPTTLIHTAPFYSADFAGYAVSMLEREWPVSTEHPVIGFFNGAEGDVVPRRLERDLKDVTRIGEQFRTAIVGVLNTGTTRTLTLGSIKVGREIIRPANNTACTPSGSTEPIRIAKNPVFGAAALGGAEGDRTILYDLGWKEGVRDIAKARQGAKLPALDSQLLRQIHLTSLLAPPESFPSELPVSYADLSGLELAAFPAEISTEEGIAIRRQLGIDAGLGHGQLELIGLADEYTSYVASPSEYALQDYMGASTIWGPQEGPFFACTAGNLKLTVDGSNDLSGTTHVDRLTFSPGQAGDGKLFGPGYVGQRRSAPDEDLEKILMDKNGNPQRELPYFEWTKTVDRKRGDFDTTAPVFTVEDASMHTIVQSDEFDFLAILEEHPSKDAKTERKWAVYWLGPLLSAATSTTEQYYFDVRLPDGTSECSQQFTVDLDLERAPAPVPKGTCPPP